jgi:serine/threonine protein kinase
VYKAEHVKTGYQVAIKHILLNTKNKRHLL